MLTKNLVRFKTSGSTITPTFIDPDDTTLLDIALELLEVFKESLGKTRVDLLEECKPIVESAPCASILVQGLQKLLIDRTEFDTEPDEELIQFRRELFTRTSQLLSQESFLDVAQYQHRVESERQTSSRELAARLYSDLPDYQPVIDFKSLSPERLLHRYNCALVQWMLLHCDQLELTLSESKPAQLRQLFKYLRFHQLLATIQKAQENAYRIIVDGPLNLFYQTTKYGRNLANFFPAVLHQNDWEFTAQIRFKGEKLFSLCLDDTCGILPYSHQFLAYIPEDIQLFQQLFHKRTSEWKISPASQFVPLEGEFYCFPDYTLVHNTGTEIPMELFHPWHASHLTARLHNVEHQMKPQLILGVSKMLLKDPLVAQSLDASDYFSHFGFIFREMPTMDKVLPILEHVLAETDAS